MSTVSDCYGGGGVSCLDQYQNFLQYVADDTRQKGKQHTTEMVMTYFSIFFGVTIDDLHLIRETPTLCSNGTVGTRSQVFWLSQLLLEDIGFFNFG